LRATKKWIKIERENGERENREREKRRRKPLNATVLYAIPSNTHILQAKGKKGGRRGNKINENAPNSIPRLLPTFPDTDPSQPKYSTTY
jgi:hypothetical protein